MLKNSIVDVTLCSKYVSVYSNSLSVVVLKPFLILLSYKYVCELSLKHIRTNNNSARVIAVITTIFFVTITLPLEEEVKLE